MKINKRLISPSEGAPKGVFSIGVEGRKIKCLFFYIYFIKI